MLAHLGLSSFGEILPDVTYMGKIREKGLMKRVKCDRKRVGGMQKDENISKKKVV
jgi:hypothetical protein